FAHITLRVGCGVVVAAAGWFPDGDAVADGEFLGADEDVLDDGAQDALAVLGGGGGRAGAEPGEEAFEAFGELEVGVAVGGLVGVVGADGFVAADASALVAVVVRAEAPVVVDLVSGGRGRGGAVVAVAAGRAGGDALQQRRDLRVPRGEPLVVFQPLLHSVEG